jgi:outer membrane protein TolC
MARRSGAAIGVLLGAALGGCHHFQHYNAIPAPSADSSAFTYAGRSLENPSLREFLARAGIPHESGPWLAQQLVLVAFYYRADLVALRAEIAGANAALVTAGSQVPLGVDVIPERAARPDEGKSSTWTVELGLDLTIETGGKRGARIARARVALAAATLDATVRTWHIASDIADAAATATGADSAEVAADSLAAATARVVGRIRDRYDRGEIGRTELARSAMDLADSKFILTDAQRARSEARVTLARVMGLSPDRIVDLVVVPATPSCPVLDSVTVDSLRARALRTRADVGLALAHYLQAETELRLAIAEQYPDIHLGPAFLWDEGIARWLLSLGLPDLIGSHARGPIVEARARRTTEAARVVVAQDSVLADVDAAVAECHVTQQGLFAADSFARATRQALINAERSYDRGESGTTEVAVAALAGSRAVRAIWEARARQSAAGLALQRVVGSWLTGPVVSWPNLAVPLSHENLGS